MSCKRTRTHANMHTHRETATRGALTNAVLDQGAEFTAKAHYSKKPFRNFFFSHYPIIHEDLKFPNHQEKFHVYKDTNE